MQELWKIKVISHMFTAPGVAGTQFLSKVWAEIALKASVEVLPH